MLPSTADLHPNLQSNTLTICRKTTENTVTSCRQGQTLANNQQREQHKPGSNPHSGTSAHTQAYAAAAQALSAAEHSAGAATLDGASDGPHTDDAVSVAGVEGGAVRGPGDRGAVRHLRDVADSMSHTA